MRLSQVTIYSRQLQSAQRQKVCQCKVGSCQICGSKFRRCMCACNGVEPADALARSRGGYRHKVNLIKKRHQRRKKIVRIKIQKENIFIKSEKFASPQ